MNVPAWIYRALDRPLGERERRAAFTAVSVVLIAAAFLLAMTGTGIPDSQQAREPRAAASGVRPIKRAVAPSKALRAARTFLDGYLAFAYGRGPASAVKDTTGSLAAALSDSPRMTPPALRGLHPRLVSLRVARSTGIAMLVTGLVKDSEVVAYPIRVQLVSRRGRYLVSGVTGA
jgi:hypothetical protein